MQTLLDVLCREHGEEYRVLIWDALRFLDEHEPRWRLPAPIDKIDFIKQLIERAQRKKEEGS